MRDRAATLLAAASITVSFLGGLALEREGMWLAIGAFVVSLLVTIHMLQPNEGLAFSLDGSKLYVRLVAVRGDLAQVHRELAGWATAVHLDNHTIVRRLTFSYRVASVSLVAQALLWVACLASIL